MAFAADSASWLSICSLDRVICSSSRFHPKVLSSLVNGKPVPKMLHLSNARVTVRGSAQIQRGLVQVIVP